MTLRNPPADGSGNNIYNFDRFAKDEVRMFAGRDYAVETSFNVGHYVTPIEFRRWNGREWEPVKHPKLPER